LRIEKFEDDEEEKRMRDGTEDGIKNQKRRGVR
jgi:hypothetical protein